MSNHMNWKIPSRKIISCKKARKQEWKSLENIMSKWKVYQKEIHSCKMATILILTEKNPPF